MLNSTISLARDFNIKPKVLGVAGNALDTLGLILTDSEIAPAGAVFNFVTLQSVGDYFGTDSNEYKAASVYFNGAVNANGTPSELLMRRFVQDVAGSAGWTRSGKITGRINSIQGLNGTIIATIDGASVTSSAIDLSAVASFDDAATAIEAGIEATVTVTWNAQLKCFFITSNTTGASSQVTITGGTIADGLLLTAATGATESLGVDTENATDMMNGITALHQNWVAFSTIFDCDNALSEEFAAWVNTTNNRYAYSMHDTDGTIINSNTSTTCNMVNITDGGYENVIPTYGDYLQAVLPLAYFASINFNVIGGRAPLKFTSYSGVTPTVTSDTQAANAEANGYNYYGSYSLNNTKKTYYSDGRITGKYQWANTWIYSVWINASLVGSFANFFTSYVSAPFNNQGYSEVRACVLPVATQAVAFGAIRAGVELDESQRASVLLQTGGKDITAELFSKGWYFFIPPQTSANRGARILDGSIFFYCDGEDIQKINMTSEVIL